MQEERSNNEETMSTSVAAAPPSPMQLVKQVRFVEIPTRFTDPSPLDWLQTSPGGDQEFHRALWYRHEEIKVFRDEAREICSKMRTLLDAEQAALRASTSTATTNTVRTPLIARDDATRGLERRACPERHRRTYLGTGLILKGATSYRHDPDKLAALAQKCTAWATTLAVTEGARDAQRAAAAAADEEAESTLATTTGTRSNSPKAVPVAVRIIPSSSLRTNPLSSSLSESSASKRLRSRQPHR